MTYEEIINNAQYIAAMPDAVALLKRYREGLIDRASIAAKGVGSRNDEIIALIEQLLNEEPKP